MIGRLVSSACFFRRLNPIAVSDTLLWKYLNRTARWGQVRFIVPTMTCLSHSLALLSLFCGTLLWQLAAARDTSPAFLKAKHLEAVKRWELSARGRSDGTRRATDDTVTLPGVKNITFSNPKASRTLARICIHFVASAHILSEFYVDGTTLPFVNFDVGPSWSGLIPISPAAHETRKVKPLANSTGLVVQFGLTHYSAVLLVFPFGSGSKSRQSRLLV